ncbi:amino acid ABC transporter permease [Terrisporobacter mayombei]|uniref:L-cystine transport system permease protein YecS n=1 Tax=Terrisporobacter mayombei TaxID=1541 RepID=A0ABY9PWF3_9FIRM|nr:amino acid ABC transporter permease [Terrisporobacter mayombei]MCC3867881.1 amino acid ABC transporter permease [Terrisporobacter mayombei]WMT80015.1 L-cystine transport system permease protein YecS [Terrisporobacter mayombei]
MNNLDFRFLIPYMHQFVDAAKITLQLGIWTFFISLLLSIMIGFLRAYKVPKTIKIILGVYVEVFRGTPLLVQLFLIYYGLPSFNITLEPMTCAIIGLSLNSAAYMSEIIRGAILSIDKGQYEAAFSLGYSKVKTYIQIILPQSFRVALPSLMNSFASIIKETSLVSIISIAEITRVGNQIYARTLRPFEVYLVIALIYLVMTYSISLLAKFIEGRSTRWSQ